MDAEVRGYLDALVDRLRAELGAAVRTSGEETREYVQATVRASSEETREYVQATVRASSEETREYVQATVRAGSEETRQHVEAAMRAGSEETRRHFDVVSEGLRDDIRTVAEGVVANRERIEQVGAEIRHDMKEDARLVHAAIRSLRTVLAIKRRGRR